MITLYDYALSGNCYKIRLLLNWLKLPYRKVLIDFYPGFEHRSEPFLKINPLGQLPVLDDDGEILRDAQAILVYLARAYGGGTAWYPTANTGQVHQWLAFADSLTATVSAARLHDAMMFDLDVAAVRSGGQRLLRILDDHLWEAESRLQKWLCPGAEASIADIACFPYVALGEEGGIEMSPYGAIRRWLERFMRIEGFDPMPGMTPLPLLKDSV